MFISVTHCTDITNIINLTKVAEVINYNLGYVYYNSKIYYKGTGIKLVNTVCQQKGPLRIHQNHGF